MPSCKEQAVVVSHAATGRKKSARGKSREPSCARDELGDVDTRLAKIKLKLIDGNEKLEELKAHVEELDKNVEDFQDKLQGALNAAIDKLAKESEST